jgi:hypothetical protein
VHVEITLERFVAQDVREVDLVSDLTRCECGQQQLHKNDKQDGFAADFHLRAPFYDRNPDRVPGAMPGLLVQA